MPDYTAVLILGVTLLFTYMTLHKEHPILAGVLYILVGGMSLIVLSDNNAYGVIIIAIGFIRILTTPVITGGGR